MDRGTAGPSHKQPRLKWSFAFCDEAGAMLMPARMAVYAPCGQTPKLLHKAAHREKVSLISAVVHHPDGAMQLPYHADPKESINNQQVAVFVRKLHAEARARGSDGVVVVWDNGNNHRGEPIRQLCRDLAGEIWLANLPPYSPDFNPDEAVWRQLKHLPDMLANFAARNLAELYARVITCMNALAADTNRLANMLKTSAIDWLSRLKPP